MIYISTNLVSLNLGNENIINASPNAKIIIVSNPLGCNDLCAYLTAKVVQAGI